MMAPSKQKRKAALRNTTAGQASQKPRRSKNPLSAAGAHSRESQTRLLLLPDGRILVHNLTPAMAQILQKLDPADRLIRQRVLAREPVSSVTHP